jgi:hypothetical protein
MLVEIIIKNNGATINKKGQCVQLKSGYQVSKRDCLKIAVEDLTEQIIEELIATGLNRGEYAGFWLDNGFIYADISVRIATKKQALPVTIIDDGRLLRKNLPLAKKDEAWVDKVLASRNATREETFLLTVDSMDHILWLPKEGRK